MKKKNGSDFKGKTTPTKNKKGTKSILVRRELWEKIHEFNNEIIYGYITEIEENQKEKIVNKR